MKPDPTFTPAAGRDLFLPLYDPLMKLLGFDRLRNALIEQAALQPGHRVLDIGCGTGTLALIIRQRYPDVGVVGLDPDPRALEQARRKAARAGLEVQFDRGYADRLDYPDAAFDRVFSSMMFHHLGTAEKDAALRAACRVLKPGGRLEFLDLSQPGAHLHGMLAWLVHAHAGLQDNVDDRIRDRMARAGFSDVKKVRGRGTLFGQVGFFQASAPGGVGRI